MLQDALATLIILFKVTITQHECSAVNVSLACNDHHTTSASYVFLERNCDGFMFTDVVQVNALWWFMLVCESVCP